MNLTAKQKRICEQVVNVFETGTIQGNYGSISIYRDGPHKIRQITYGRSQTTEYGNLYELVQRYVDADGTFSDQLGSYVGKIGVTPLVDDRQFKKLLRDAGRKDPVMRRVQDDFFDKRYFQPAVAWAEKHGFSLPLSALVIYDSFIHSGSILYFLRQRFPEKPPAKGGDEKTWIRQYVDARQNWLATHQFTILHATVYRTQCFKGEIARGNWDLSQLPIDANGVDVFGD
jgi:chitosanase